MFTNGNFIICFWQTYNQQEDMVETVKSSSMSTLPCIIFCYPSAMPWWHGDLRGSDLDHADQGQGQRCVWCRTFPESHLGAESTAAEPTVPLLCGVHGEPDGYGKAGGKVRIEPVTYWSLAIFADSIYSIISSVLYQGTKCLTAEPDVLTRFSFKIFTFDHRGF